MERKYVGVAFVLLAGFSALRGLLRALFTDDWSEFIDTSVLCRRL
jgi:hypothetical protein